MGIELTPGGQGPDRQAWLRPGAGCPSAAPGASSATSRTILAEKILFSELKSGEIVVVDVATRVRSRRSPSPGCRGRRAPDTPPVEFGGVIEGLIEPGEPGEAVGDR